MDILTKIEPLGLSIGVERREISGWLPPEVREGIVETVLTLDGSFGGIPDKVIVNGVEFIRPLSS